MRRRQQQESDPTATRVSSTVGVGAIDKGLGSYEETTAGVGVALLCLLLIRPKLGLFAQS